VTRHVAFVGTAGGVGTTRTVVETAAALARDGRRVRVLDAAYATQGLARFLDGRIDTDVTAVCADDAAEAAASYELGLSTPGGVAVTPAHAPFERVARAKTTSAASPPSPLPTVSWPSRRPTTGGPTRSAGQSTRWRTSTPVSTV
jgi:cellulose biosynthesis protein BcsQ